jgi:phage terminase large subunit-like protein
MTSDEARKRLDLLEASIRREAEDDFHAFLDAIDIPSASGKRRFRDCMSSFQRRFFNDVAPALHAVRDSSMPDKRRFWLERTKKASKDMDIAICVVWLMAFAKRPILVQVVAANQKQSGIVKRRVEALLFDNEWLRDRVRVVVNKIHGACKAETVIEATGSSGAAQGETPDLLILNELVHVDRWSVMETHRNNADGVPQGVVLISTNAGFKGTPAHRWKLDAEDSSRWTVHEYKGKAPWIDQEDMDEAEQRNKGSEFKRLWLGIWVSGRGDAVTEEDVDRCFRTGAEPVMGPEPGWRYVGGLDLGVSHDHAGGVFLGVHEGERRIRLAQMRSWKPVMETAEGPEVDLMSVEEWMLTIAKLLHAEVWYDPHQAKLMAQRLTRRGVRMREMSFGKPSNLTAMADSFVQVIEDGMLECWDDPEGTLRRDFGKFDISESNRRRKLEATSDEFGHADVGTALAICLPRAVELVGGLKVQLREDDVLAEDGEVQLKREEVEEMPDSLRELYEMDYSQFRRLKGERVEKKIW